jgi:translocation and assembly module TamB
MGRRLFYAFLTILAFLLVLLIGAKVYLASHATPQVVARLQSALGMRVQVGTADVGLSGGSELKDVQIFEPPAPANERKEPNQPTAPEKPWFRVDRVEADVSVLSLLSGSTGPAKVHLEGVSVILRFDKDGKLLTHLPTSNSSTKGELPELLIDGGQLTIDQAGRTPFVLAGIRGSLTPAGSTLKITGNIADTYWGKWDIGGKIDPGSSGIALTLDTTSTDVTAEKLKKIPFVPPSIWDEVTADGKTSVRLALTLAPNASDSHYKVELVPTGARVRISSIALETDQVHGKIVVDDQVVTLAKVAGRAAEGTISADGKLDFHTNPSQVNLDVTAKDVLVRRLPPSWELPEVLDGKLTGDAKLRLRLTSPIQTEGSSGEGTVTGVAVLGLGKGEARIYLHPGPGRIRFRQEPPAKQGAAAATVPTVLTGLTRPDAPPPPNAGIPAIGNALNLVAGGLQQSAKAITSGTTSTMRWMRQMNKPLPPGQAPSYFEANLSLRDVDLGELIQRAKITLPFPVEGKLSFQINVGFPVDTPRDFQAYRFQGDAQLSRLVIAGFEMANVRTRLRYANGALVLETLHAETPYPGGLNGWFDGTARYQIIPPGDLKANLRVERVPAAAARQLLPASEELKGRFSGTLQLEARGGQLKDPSAWEASTHLQSDSLSAYGVTLRDFAGSVQLTHSAVTLTELQGKFEGAPITGTGKLQLAGDFPFAANLTLPGLDLGFFERLDPSFRAPVPVKGRLDLSTLVKGTLRPWKIDTTGTARASNLTIDSVRVNSLAFRYAVATDRITVTDARAELYRGTVTGTATLPMQATQAGDIALTISGVDARSLLQDLPAIPVKLDGVVSGNLTAKLPPSTRDKPRETTLTTELSAPDLRIQGIPTRRIRCNVTYRGNTGSYRVEGDLAGGTFKLEGPLGAPAAPAAPNAPQSGTFQLRDIRLSQFAETMFPAQRFSALRGTLDLNLPFQYAADGIPTGLGAFAITRVRWGTNTLTDRLQGEVRLGSLGVTLSDVNATLAGGDLRLSAGYRFGLNGLMYVNLELFHADANRLLAPFPTMVGLVDGPVDLSFRLSGNRELRGMGRAVLTRGKMLGVDVTDWRVPMDVAFVPGGRGQLEIRDSSGQFGHGRAQARANLTWGDSTRLDGNIRFFDADLRSLVGRDSEAANYASGKLTGTLDFNSDNFQSADDLNATLSATLKQAQAGSVPILQQIIPFMGLVGVSGSTRFQEGELQGRLAHGTFRVQKCALYGSVAQLMVEGDVTLSGRVDLQVTLGTSSFGLSSRGLTLLGLRIPAIGPLPLALILDASALLANRIVHLRVSGTLANPSVRVEPTALLSEEAVRFFLNRAGLPITP